MKFVTGIVASLVIGSLSFGAFAAKEIQKDEVAKMNLTKIGSITTSRTTSPMDAKRDLSKKADELGGTYFVVIAGEKNEKTVHANADVYKKARKRVSGPACGICRSRFPEAARCACPGYPPQNRTNLWSNLPGRGVNALPGLPNPKPHKLVARIRR